MKYKFVKLWKSLKKITNGQWDYLKHCMFDAADEVIEGGNKKEWLAEEMLKKMKERRKWNYIGTEEG